ncbi:hypothetical protein [Ideonella livida]|uniref:HPt domain-containing protein n=1 Tax=Ideonella livida TaxID=2707176 RepID=A0A7C9PGI1_9BURK|nr:hypothetical protein [Ideonella livida]NDY90852.1 hypothetical protein [Ideonella livida]
MKQFFHTLTGLQGGIGLYKEGIDEFLLSHGYPRYKEEVEAIRDGLEDLGLYEVVRGAIDRSEVLVREGQFEEAEMLVLEANRKLSKASGVDDDLRRLYKSAND